MDNLKKLKEDRAALVTKIQSLRDKATSENRQLTEEEMTEFRSNAAACKDIDDQIAFFVGNEEVAKRNAAAGLSKTQAEERRAQLGQFLHDVESRNALDGVTGVPFPKFVFDRVITAMADKGEFLKAVETISTADGNDLIIPTYNGTGLTFALVSEYNEVSAQSSSLSNITLKAYNYAGLLIVSKNYINDATFDLEGYMVQQLSDNLSRFLNSESTTQTTSGKINGILAQTTLGKTASSTTAITYDELVDLVAAVNRPYSGKAVGKFMMNSQTLAAISKIKDSDGRPIFVMSAAEGQPDRILGRAIVINEDMPDIAASAKPIVFGDLSQYKLRIVNSIETTVLREKFATSYAIGLLCNVRADGRLCDAGTHPVKHLAMAAS